MTTRRELLRAAAERGRYQKLYLHLKNRRDNKWETSFREIEKVIGFKLPDSARIHRPWWANQAGKGGHSHALAWEMAGWKTQNVDLADEKLVFVRSTNAV